MKHKKQIIAILVALLTTIGALNAQQKYALIIGGDYNPGTEIPDNHKWNNGDLQGSEVFDEFWNDTYLMWELLYDYKYRYSNDNIKVLFADGVDYTFDGQYPGYSALQTYGFNITDDLATEVNVKQALLDLDSKMTVNDYLFVWIMSNGGNTPTGDSYVYLWDYPDPHPDYDGLLYDYELNALLDDIQADKKVVIVQAPNSGGFAAELAEDNTLVYTSSGLNMQASRANDTPNDDGSVFSFFPN